MCMSLLLTELKKWFWIMEKPIDAQITKESYGPSCIWFTVFLYHRIPRIPRILRSSIFYLIIMINVASGLYHERNNKYEMVEKIGIILALCRFSLGVCIPRVLFVVGIVSNSF